MGAAFSSLLDDAWEGAPLPREDGRLVAFTGTAARFLRRPFQPLVQETSNVIVMESDAKMKPDQFGNAVGGPQVVGPTVGVGALSKQLFQASLLRARQPRRGATMRLGGQAVRTLSHLKPTVHGAFCDTDDAGDILCAVALLNCLNSLASPLLQGRGRSTRSTHVKLEGIRG
jgi:hypothetical protein